MAVTLEAVLQNREERLKRQQDVARRTKAALISFTMCIPGEIKNDARITAAFISGLQTVLDMLRKNALAIKEVECNGGNTGPECIIAVMCDPVILKQLVCEIEEHHQYGRLFDFDILDNRLKAISRRDVGKEERRCFICDRAAHLCARARTHSLHELKQAVQRYLA